MKSHPFAAYMAVLAPLTAGLPLAAQPAITIVQNNYSYILPNLPNYGIAPGSLFVIIGSGLANAVSQATPTSGLPLTLNGASVNVTVNGAPTQQPGLYYATPTAIAGVLPSTTPVGKLTTITVSYSGAISQPYNIIVPQSAFGFDTYYGTGSGTAAVTDNFTGSLISPTNSAKPGETIVFWGSGVGPDLKNDDRGDAPISVDNLNFITQLFIGGMAVPIIYQGRSFQYPGVDQVDVTLPANVPTGCAVSVVAVSGTGGSAVVSNTVTLPISANGGTCVDALQPTSSTELATLASQPLVKFGSLSLSQITSPAGVTTKSASGEFAEIVGPSLFPYLSNTLPSLGSCVVYQQAPPAPTNPFQLEGLSPGTVDITSNSLLLQQSLGTTPSGPGFYTTTLTSGFIPPNGGPFTFAGQGGTDVQPFTASVNFPSPLNWTNSTAVGTITRAQGLTVNWTGGDASTYVQISGNATTVGATVYFTCDAPVSPPTFTVPPAVLLALPTPATGVVAVSNISDPAGFSATGLNFGFATATASVVESTTYQ